MVVSRGGLGALYHPGVQTVDLYALRGVESVVAENRRARAEFGVNKPLALTAWERDVWTELGHTAIVHPSQMVTACRAFWEAREGLRSVAARTDVTPLMKPPKPDWLPEHYTAVKWYHREGVEHAGVTAAWQRIVRDLAARGPVVWVSGGGGFDQHVEGCRGELQAMPEGPVDDNLLRQAAVLAHADRFVGTYGGLAHLALRLGVPTVALYPAKEPRHRAFNQWIARETDVPFVSGSLADMDVMRAVV